MRSKDGSLQLLTRLKPNRGFCRSARLLSWHSLRIVRYPFHRCLGPVLDVDFWWSVVHRMERQADEGREWCPQGGNKEEVVQALKSVLDAAESKDNFGRTRPFIQDLD